MTVKTFIQHNFVLLIGLFLPILLMAGFLVASTLPGLFGAPPKYDLVFAAAVYGDDMMTDNVVAETDRATRDHPPVSLQLLVGKDGMLRARYKRLAKDDTGHDWLKLYIYETKTGKVRALPLPVPKDADTIKTTRDDIVEATRNYRLDPRDIAPDGYHLAYGGGSNTGLLGDFFGHSYSSNYYGSPSLEKGRAKTLLTNDNGIQFDTHGSPNLVGWVVGANQP